MMDDLDRDDAKAAPAPTDDLREAQQHLADATKSALSAVAKLKAYKERNEGTAAIKLPETGIRVTYPKFRSHGMLMKAMRLAKGDARKGTDILITQICRFDGEQFTLEDLALLPMGDSNALSAEVFGDGDGDDAGNVTLN